MLLAGTGIAVHGIGRFVASRCPLGLSLACRLAVCKILALGFLPLGRKTASEVLPLGSLAFGGLEFGVFGGLPFSFLPFGGLPFGVFGGLPFSDLAFGGLEFGVFGGLPFGYLAFGGLAFGRLPSGCEPMILGLDGKSSL